MEHARSPTSEASAAPNLAAVRELFDRAVDLPADERAAFLETQTRQPAVVSQVLSLLHRHDSGAVLTATPRADGPPGSGPPGAARLSAGDRVGEWTIDRLIFRSDLSEVYRAIPGHDAPAVAIKLLLTPASDPEAWRRLRLEAQVLSGLKHPGIVGVLDSGRGAAGPIEDLPYLVTPYIDGVPIDQRLTAGRAPWREVASMLADAAEAVHHANLRGVVHRDLKPSNLLVDSEGRVCVIDFGVARSLEDMGIETSASMRTLATSIVGTPDFMAPEQFNPRERDVDLRADVYGLGSVAYHLLLGRPPHDLHGLSLAQIAILKQTQSPAPLRRLLGRRVSVELSDVIAVALAPRPDGRHESCGALAEDLRRVLEGLPPRRRSPGVVRRAALFARRRPEVIGLAAMLVVAAAGGVAGIAWQGQQAAAQRDIARQRFNETRTLARDLIFGYSRQLEARSDTLEPRRWLVTRATTYLDGLSRDIPSDPREWSPDDRALVLELAQARIRLGDILGNVIESNLGDGPGAVAQIELGLELVRRLLEIEGDDARALWILGTGMRSHMYAKEYARPDDSTVLIDMQETLATLERAALLAPGDADIATDLAATRILRALYLWRILDRPEDGVAEADRGVERLRTLAAEGAAEHAPRWLAEGLRYRADLVFRRDGTRADPSAFLGAAEEYRLLLLEVPGHPLHQANRANCLARAGLLLAHQGQPDRGIGLAEEGLAITSRLAEQNPTDRFHWVKRMTMRTLLAETYAAAASGAPDADARRGWLRAAAATYDVAIGDLESLIERGWERGTLFEGYIRDVRADQQGVIDLLREGDA